MLSTKTQLTFLTFIITIAAASFITTVVAAEDNSGKAPKVPFQYSLGMQKYQQLCSGCHGKWLGGTDQGPPLMHPFYKPSHHSDATFYRAVLSGVKAHHWEFGDMPRIDGATRKEVDAIVPFVRWFQQEKGLY